MKMPTSIMTMIFRQKAAIEKLGHIPVNIQPWERDDDGLMYATSLLEQLENIHNEKEAEDA